MFNKKIKRLEIDLVNRETHFFLNELKKVFDTAVNEVQKRGLLSSGLGASTVKQKFLESVKGRMKNIALELTTIQLGQKKLNQIQKNLSDKYIRLTKSILSKMSPWANDSSSLEQKEFLGTRSENSLRKYFQTEFDIALVKQFPIKNFSKNFFGGIREIFNFGIKLISLFK